MGPQVAVDGAAPRIQATRVFFSQKARSDDNTEADRAVPVIGWNPSRGFIKRLSERSNLIMARRVTHLSGSVAANKARATAVLAA